MHSLTWLDITGNRRLSLPDVIPLLVHVVEIHIGDFGLCAMPIELRLCIKLQVLGLAKNTIRDIPVWMPELANLRKLDLSHNGRQHAPRIQNVYSK